jgi:general secretion pathway protein A
MLGQPELREILKQPQLLQLSQRITARYHLGHLSREEVPAYVNYRLLVAGLARGQLFLPQTLKRLYRLSGGIPRLINVICDRALLGTYVQGKDQVDMETLMTSAREVSGEDGHKRQRQRIFYGVLAGFLLVILTALGTIYYMQKTKTVTMTSLKPAIQEPIIKAKKNPVKKTTLERPVNYTTNATMEMAYQALFKQWQLQYSRGDGRTVCEQARKQGLQCLKGKGNIGHLRLMNRPIVLTLADEKGDEYFAALISLRGEIANFVIGNEIRNIDVNEITRWWTGDYFILWRAPSGYKEKLKPGDRGPMVAWLDRQLAFIQGRPAPTGREQVYHGEIVKEVKRLQLTAGLLADGIVGPRTIIYLTAADDNGGPVLHEGKRDN